MVCWGRVPAHSTPWRSPATPSGREVCRSAPPTPARRCSGDGQWWRRRWRWSWFWWWWYVEPSVADEGGDVVMADRGAGTQSHELPARRIGALYVQAAAGSTRPARNCPQNTHVRVLSGSVVPEGLRWAGGSRGLTSRMYASRKVSDRGSTSGRSATVGPHREQHRARGTSGRGVCRCGSGVAARRGLPG